MRVLIDPYENTDGDLIITGYVTRRYRLVKAVFLVQIASNAVLKPLQTPDNRNNLVVTI